MKNILKKLTALIAASVTALSLCGCGSASPYFDAAAGFFERTVNAFSKDAGKAMREFRDRIAEGPDQKDWESFFEEYFSPEDQQTPQDTTDPAQENAYPDPDETDRSETKPEPSEEASAESSSGADASAKEETEEHPSYIESEYIPAYEHYDTEKFNKLCEEFIASGNAADKEKTRDLYDELIEELKILATMDTVAFLNYSKNVNDEYYDSEYSFCEKAYTDCFDQFMVACRKVMESKGGEAFEKHADSSIVEEAADYEALTDETKKLLDQETRLESDYDKTIDGLENLTYEYKGKVYTFGQLYDDVSPLSMLAMFNYNDFLTVYEGLLKTANDTVGPIYIELLQVRKELAKAYGYDNYADYCYEKEYGREYTPKDADEFCNYIKEQIGSRFYGSGVSSYIYNASYFSTVYTTDEMFDIVDDFTKGFDKEINDSLQELRNKKLYDIGEGDGRYAGSYTTTVYTEAVPFIFINEENTTAGLSTLEHEFGHFTNALYEEKDPDNFYREANFDVMEIHSNSLQLLCSNHYGEILDYNEALKAVQYEVAFQLHSVLDGCIYDEFQRKAYENPDMTLDELNELYGSLCKEYGQVSTPGNEYMWILVTHTFDSPMYYISYAVSALSALEIWQISRTAGEEKAIDVWLELMHEKDDEDYETVLKKVGLTPFTDTEAAVNILSNAMDDLVGSDLVTVPSEVAA